MKKKLLFLALSLMFLASCTPKTSNSNALDSSLSGNENSSSSSKASNGLHDGGIYSGNI